MRSSFLLSEAVQKCQVRWQYVKYGNMADLYKVNLALVGMSFLSLIITPTLSLAFLHHIYINMNIKIQLVVYGDS